MPTSMAGSQRRRQLLVSQFCHCFPFSTHASHDTMEMWLALRSGDRMAETTTAVLSVIGTTTEHIDPLPFLRRTEDDQISRFPEEHLALFYAALPENAALWPWGVGQVIEQLIEVPALKGDSRLAELRRRLARI